MPAPYNYLDKTGLTNLWAKIKEKFVVKELKTDSDSEYKVLSDNNLTDELKQKILDAGDSSFDGQYTSLTGKPQIEGHELASGNNTAASLGLATPTDVSNAVNDMATQTWVGSQGFAKTSEVTSQIATATADMATKTWVGQQGYATTSNVNTLISAAVSGAYKAKGSSTFASLPALTAATVGDVYNVSDAFNTTADFVEGAGQSYGAGTNIVCVDSDGEGTKKWDVLAGFVNLTEYVKGTDLVAITSTEIDDICV